MLYKALGFVVWQVGKRVVKRKVGAKLPSRQVGAGVLVALLVAVAAGTLWKRESAEARQ